MAVNFSSLQLKRRGWTENMLCLEKLNFQLNLLIFKISYNFFMYLALIFIIGY